MYKFKKSLIALIGVLTLVGIATVTIPQIGRGASGTSNNAPASQTQNVNVVNTPTVNAQQSGTWNVGINGTPNVGIDPGNNIVRVDTVAPLAVYDVDNGQQPYQQFLFIQMNDGEARGADSFPVVPAGKRLVIEFAGAEGALPQGQKLQLVKIGANAGGFFLDYPLEMTAQGIDIFSNRELYVGSKQVRLYTDPGRFPEAIVQRSSGTGDATVLVMISGYLVSLP